MVENTYDYAIQRTITVDADHVEFVRALGHEPGQVFYLSDTIEGPHNPAILEWSNDIEDALQMTLESARLILALIEGMQIENRFYQHTIYPPEPQAEA